MMKSIICLALIAVVVSADAESFYPALRVGDTWEYHYKNIVAYEGETFGMTNVTNGRMVLRIVGRAVTNGTEYFQGVTEYEGIFGIPPQTTLIRVDAEGYYTGMEIHGTFVESRALAFPPEPGVRWPYYDGEKGWRTIAAREPVEADGYRYDDCIRVDRGFDDEAKARQFTQREWYCRERGLVRYHFVQRMGPTLSDTQTILSAYKPGGG